MNSVSILSLILLSLTLVSGALDPIVVKGNLFFNAKSGAQFWVKGVDYQPKLSTNANYDVLGDHATIDRDLPYLTGLGINAIRVYETNASLNHDYAMQKLSTAGIYVIIDIPTPLQSINSEDPTWDLDLYRAFTAKIDAFSSYDNTLAFVASNEVSNQPSNTAAAAFVKAAIRDVKAYIKSKGLNFPVGYAVADAGSIVEAQENYFACGASTDIPDFYGINIYRWCGASSFHESGYDVVTQTFTNWPTAVLFSEYGCNQVKPRIFTEVDALYSTNMTNVFSGGLIYEYSQEENQFGLVQLNLDAGNTVTTLTDYTNYKTRLAEINPTGTTMAAYTPTPITVACPAVDASWQAASSPLPPVVDEQYCTCLLNSLKCRTIATSSSQLSGVQAVADAYTFICQASSSYCSDLSTNATQGIYGKYSMCDAVTRLSIAMNNYYAVQTKQDATSCNFEGLGKIVTPSTTATSCVGASQSSGNSAQTHPSASGTASGTASETASETPSCGTSPQSQTQTQTRTGSDSLSPSSGSLPRTSNAMFVGASLIMLFSLIFLVL